MKVDQAGVDTWSLAWRIREDSAAERAMRSLASVKVKRGYALPEQVAGHLVGWFPSSRLVFAEGHPGGDRLGRADDFASVALAVEEGLHSYGIPVPLNAAAWDRVGSPGFVGVRRLDVTADLRFESPADGLAALAGVASLPMSRMKSAAWRGSRGHLETVAFYGHAGKKMLARWYDKGVESSSAPRGTLLRPEDQRRWSSGARRGVEELTAAYVRDKFHQRFLPLWQATKGITVGSQSVIVQRVVDLVADDTLTARQATTLLGYTVLESSGHSIGKGSTTRRYRSQLRRHGLVLADDHMQEIEVDLHAVMEATFDADAWGCG